MIGKKGKILPLNINCIAKIGLSLYSLCTDFLISAMEILGSTSINLIA